MRAIRRMLAAVALAAAAGCVSCESPLVERWANQPPIGVDPSQGTNAPPAVTNAAPEVRP